MRASPGPRTRRRSGVPLRAVTAGLCGPVAVAGLVVAGLAAAAAAAAAATAAATAATAAAAAATAATAADQESRVDLERGRTIYLQKCAHCHGTTGRGDGPGARFQEPAPRDFTAGHFKIRSTPFGNLPTDEDLFNVISRGMPGTQMPAWDDLSPADRRALVAVVKSFSPRFAREEPGPVVDLRGRIKATAAVVAAGRQLYREAKCHLCHGEEGRGDGPITVTLRAAWGRPIRARNLTLADRFKGGNRVEDIFRTITTGLNGTPMGPYERLLGAEERWSLAHYVKSLSEATDRLAAAEAVVLTSRRISGAIPSHPDAEGWRAAAPLMIRLAGQVIRRPRLWAPTADRVRVRSLYNRDRIAFLIEWDDPTGTGPETLADQVALQFPARPRAAGDPPYFLSGAPGGEVWQWRWISSGASASTDSIGGVRRFRLAGLDRAPAAAGAPEEIRGSGWWRDGRWRVVVVGPRSNGGQTDAGGGSSSPSFPAGTMLPIALQVWDGSNLEYGGRLALSSWYYLTLEPRRSFAALAVAGVAALAGLFFADSALVRLRRSRR